VKVQIVVFDGADELDVLGPYEVLALAERYGAPLEVRLVTIDPRDEVTGDHGVTLRPHGPLDEADLLIVPGGGWNDRSARGARAEAERGDVPRAVAAAHARGATVASVCTGAMLLAAAGILEGRPAVTHRSALGDLEAAGARIVDARVVDDGDVLTAGGVTSGLDLALWIVQREFGVDLYERVAAELEHEQVGEVARTD
jgi:transcriptional regulator GlxA family with amidase domain